MEPKPSHLGPDRAAAFQHQSVVTAYPSRPPYPKATFAILKRLLLDEPSAVLDLGCGTGDLARPMVKIAPRVDAVDFSASMIALGKISIGGNHPHLHWITWRAEDAPLNPPYRLITAGESLHWMDWPVLLPRLAGVLTINGSLAIVTREQAPSAWDEELAHIIPRYSTNPDYQPINLSAELARRGLFRQLGEAYTKVVGFQQPLEAYIEAFHSMSSFSRELMSAKAAAAFDDEVRTVVSPFLKDGLVELWIRARVSWGKPLGL